MESNAYQRITDRILELLAQGVCPWRKPWSHHDTPPHNYATGRCYSGINHMLLSSSGFDSPQYLTFRQVNELGGSVKKGSKGLPVVYWGNILPDAPVSETNASVSTESAIPRSIPFLRVYIVFNAAQIEGVEFKPLVEVPPRNFEPIAEAARIVNDWKECPPIEHGKARAGYSPVEDKIVMPDPTRFTSDAEYYATLFHEMGHATGHASRLNRPIHNTFRDPAYSREELVAEMTSAFLCVKCGIDNAVIDNQAAYLSGWNKALKGDSRMIVTAAGQAQRAANMIQGTAIERPTPEVQCSPTITPKAVSSPSLVMKQRTPKRPEQVMSMEL